MRSETILRTLQCSHAPILRPPPTPTPTAGGNQRELARAKAAKKAAEAGKGQNKESGLSLTQRRERDAAIMREKQAVSGHEARASGAVSAYREALSVAMQKLIIQVDLPSPLTSNRKSKQSKLPQLRPPPLVARGNESRQHRLPKVHAPVAWRKRLATTRSVERHPELGPGQACARIRPVVRLCPLHLHCHCTEPRRAEPMC